MKETNNTDEKIIASLRSELEKPEYKGYLREVDEENLQEILTQLVNKCVHDEGFNVNTLISADDPEVANTYGTAIAEALETVFSFEMCTPVTIEQLYKWNAEHRKDNPDTKVLLVKSFETSDPEELFNTLTEFQNQNFNPAVILCTNNETVEELRKYSAVDSILYNYLCGLRKIIIPGIDQKDIADIICDRLEGEGKEVKDSFREKLAVHVEAIYEDAVLSREAFLEDLIIRIKSVHAGKSVDLWDVYDEEDVPYSVKAEALWESKHTAEMSETVQESEKDLTPSDQNTKQSKSDDAKEKSEKKNEICSVINSEEKEPLEADFTPDESLVKAHHILLLAMSTLGKKISNNNFKRPEIDKKKLIEECEKEELIVDCQSQLEPVAKLFLEEVNENSITDFVIMGTEDTSKVDTGYIESEGVEVDISAEMFFIYRILLYLNESCSFSAYIATDQEEEKKVLIYHDRKRNITIRFNILKIDENNPIKGLGDTVNEIRDLYKRYNNASKRMWVETHGGFRDVTFMMMSLLSLLKNENIVPEKIYGVHFPVGKDIYEQKETFGMSDFVTGMNDFFNFGSASVLKNLAKKDDKDDFLEALNKIAEGTQLCDPYLYRSGVEVLIQHVAKKESNAEKDLAIDSELDIFAKSIVSDFGKILDTNPESVELDLEIIERCVNKGLYQQALTFIETLMPRYFFEKKVFYCSDEDKKRISEAKKKNDYRDKKCENIIFDSNLPWFKGDKNEKVTSIISQYAKRSFNDIVVTDNTKMKEAVFKDMYHIDNKKFNDNHTVYKKFNDKHTVTTYGLEKELEIPVMTDIDHTFHKIVAEIFFIHSVLKQCRNIFNHGMASETTKVADNNSNVGKNEIIMGKRPSIGDIDSVIKKYLSNVRKINTRNSK